MFYKCPSLSDFIHVLTSNLNCKIGDVFEFSTFPSTSPNLSSSKEESTIWDARVDVNTTLVHTIGEFLEVLPVRRLRVLPYSIIIISCSRTLHIL